jgi:type IV pilus assembly protein PilV
MKKMTSFQSGLSMVEIMVSIIIMAVGLLGLAGLQMNAMKYQKSSSQRSEASDAAYDLSERMRANAAFRDTYLSPNNTYATGAVPITASDASCGLVSSCTGATIAQNDLNNWYRTVQRRLVGGSGSLVTVPGATIPTYDVTLMWIEQGFTSTDASCPAGSATPVGVRCFTYRFTP